MRKRGSLAVAFVSLAALHCGGELSITGSGAGGSGGTGGSGAGGAGGGGAPGLQIEGLTAAVTGAYDDNGLLHVTCQEDDDCYAALGYFHASNRFFFMDFIRSLVRGKLASLVKAGDTVLEVDYENRRFFTSPDGTPVEQKLYDNGSDRAKGHFDAYTRGVNAWIADMRANRNGATLTTEYDFALIVKDNIRDWEPEDSAAVGLYVLNDLSNNSDGELALAQAINEFDPLLAPDLFTPKPVFEASTISGFTPAPYPAGLPIGGGSNSSFLNGWYAKERGPATRGLISEARRAMSKVGGAQSWKGPGDTGSNNWIVGPTKSASGNALLANDPHLQLTNPSIWFAVELDAKSAGNGSYHVAGSTFPGLPSVMVGHNEMIAWGVTTAYYDLADVYLEELNDDGSAVVINGTDVPILEKEYEFLDAQSGDTIKKTFRYSQHGPIVSEDLAAKTAVSIRWTGHEGGTDLDGFFGLARAETFEEAKSAIEFISSASQNFVVIDVEGNFGWFPYIKIPERPWASNSVVPWLPIPGEGSAEWGPPVALEDLPQAENVADGFLATANADMIGASFDGDLLNDGPSIQTFPTANGARQRRILDLLAAENAHTVDSLVAIQGDTYSLFGAGMKQAFIDAAAVGAIPPEQQDVIDALVAWQGTCPTGVVGDPKEPTKDPEASIATESIGCTAFHAVFFAAVYAGMRDEIEAAGLTSASGFDQSLIARSLLDPTNLASGDLVWDNVSTGPVETRNDTLRVALQLAATALAEFGGPDDWRWGFSHTITLRSVFDNFGVPTYNEGPYAAPGGLHAVNVANPSVRLPEAGKPFDFSFRAGPSIRFVVEAHPEGPKMVYQLPGGNDLHRDSPFYNNLLPNWLNNTPIEFPFGPDAVPNPAVVVVIEPKP